MPNRTEARSAKAARTHATGRLPSLRLFSTLLIFPRSGGATVPTCYPYLAGIRSNLPEVSV
jgi:hypothetical protein